MDKVAPLLISGLNLIYEKILGRKRFPPNEALRGAKSNSRGPIRISKSMEKKKDYAEETTLPYFVNCYSYIYNKPKKMIYQRTFECRQMATILRSVNMNTRIIEY